MKERRVSIKKLKQLVRPQTSYQPYNGFSEYQSGVFERTTAETKDEFLELLESQISKNTLFDRKFSE